MNLTPVSKLRRASKGHPTLQELGKKLGCSAMTLSKFELGQQAVSPQLMAKYARAIGITLRRLQDVFAIAEAAYYNRKAAEANRNLEERLGVKTLPPRRVSAAE